MLNFIFQIPELISINRKMTMKGRDINFKPSNQHP